MGIAWDPQSTHIFFIKDGMVYTVYSTVTQIVPDSFRNVVNSKCRGILEAAADSFVFSLGLDIRQSTQDIPSQQSTSTLMRTDHFSTTFSPSTLSVVV